MKRPRVEDFDPNAHVPELGSPMDQLPRIEKPTRVLSVEKESVRPNARTAERPNARTGRRIITRNSFEIYEDQMESLRKLSFQEKMEGKLGSMSQMVREAIDHYLKERTSGS